MKSSPLRIEYLHSAELGRLKKYQRPFCENRYIANVIKTTTISFDPVSLFLLIFLTQRFLRHHIYFIKNLIFILIKIIFSLYYSIYLTLALILGYVKLLTINNLFNFITYNYNHICHFSLFFIVAGVSFTKIIKLPRIF